MVNKLEEARQIIEENLQEEMNLATQLSNLKLKKGGLVCQEPNCGATVKNYNGLKIHYDKKHKGLEYPKENI